MAADISDRLDRLDLSLFTSIASQSSDGDRQSWLAVQRAMRRPDGYTYLEIGSHLGGSVQQHLVDPLCRAIISIDKRPLVQPDDRGQDFVYEGNSTDRMLDNLRAIDPAGLAKLTTFDADASTIPHASVPAAPTFCFIDGEHTATAVVSDFTFCLAVADPNAAILFHDDVVIHRALRQILAMLRQRQLPFTARKLPGFTFAIFLGHCQAAQDEFIRTRGVDGASWLRQEALKTTVRRFVPDSAVPLVKWLAGRVVGTH